MIYLPVEILRYVFHLLVQKDQLECMTVCRRWHDIIQGHSLFRTIFIYHHEQLDQLFEKVKANPIIGEKVERLTLQLHLEIDYGTKIIEHFPNLRDFALINLNDNNMGNKTILPQHAHPWRKKMEKIVENKSDLNTKTLLLSGLCKRLTYISVWGDDGPVRSLIEAIVGAPGLTTLHLRRYTVSFEDLEVLHEAVPLLNSLLLNDMKFSLSPHLLDIEPATLIKSFRCLYSDFSSYGSVNPHLPYFTQKYTHLEDLAFEMEIHDCRKELWIRDTNMIASYIKELGPRLKTSSVTVVDFLTQNSIDIDEDTMDVCHCQIKKLDVDTNFFEYVSESTQVESIQALAVNKIDYHLNYDSGCLESLKYFTMLKELTLNFTFAGMHNDGHQLCLEYLLDILGENQLETLCVYNGQLNFDDSLITLVYPSLKELRLFNVTFAVGVDTFISRVFSNLKRLKLENCFGNGDSLMLPSTDLSYLEVVSTEINGEFAIMVISLGDGKRRVYSAITQPSSFRSYRSDIEDDIFNLPPIYSERYEKAEYIPMVTIVCNSVYDFFMTNSETN